MIDETNKRTKCDEKESTFKIACREPRLVRRGSDVKGENGL